MDSIHYDMDVEVFRVAMRRQEVLLLRHAEQIKRTPRPPPAIASPSDVSLPARGKF
jgi:hypothetical protein